MFKCPQCKLKMVLCDCCKKVFVKSSDKWYLGNDKDNERKLYKCCDVDHVICEKCVDTDYIDDKEKKTCPCHEEEWIVMLRRYK